MTRKGLERMPGRVLTAVLVLLTAAFISGCVTRFKENHYFSSESKASELDRPNNFFRLTINGWSIFTSTRYVSGFYDERAVDLFFNEIKADPQPLFPNQLVEPGSEEVIRPLTPGPERGALVLILSTNADAVADAIGSFGEGQAAAAAVTNLLSRDAIREARLTSAEQTARRRAATALVGELDALFGQVDPAQKEELNRQYLRIANALGQARNPPVSFGSLSDLADWRRARTTP